jgi:hypothetical protein
MTRTEELMKLCGEAQHKKQTFYDGPLDWSDQRQALAYALGPSTVKQLVELVRLQHEALVGSQALEHLRDFKKEAKAIAAFEKFEGGGK